MWILVWTRLDKQWGQKVEWIRVKRESLGVGKTGLGVGLWNGYRNFGLQLKEWSYGWYSVCSSPCHLYKFKKLKWAQRCVISITIYEARVIIDDRGSWWKILIVSSKSGTFQECSHVLKASEEPQFICPPVSCVPSGCIDYSKKKPSVHYCLGFKSRNIHRSTHMHHWAFKKETEGVRSTGGETSSLLSEEACYLEKLEAKWILVPLYFSEDVCFLM